MPDNKPSFISYIMLYPPISSNIPHIFVVKITIYILLSSSNRATRLSQPLLPAVKDCSVMSILRSCQTKMAPGDPGNQGGFHPTVGISPAQNLHLAYVISKKSGFSMI